MHFSKAHDLGRLSVKVAGDSMFAGGGTEQLCSAGRCSFHVVAGAGGGARGSGTQAGFHRSSINGYKGEDALWSPGKSSSVSPGGAIAMANLLAALTPVRHH